MERQPVCITLDDHLWLLFGHASPDIVQQALSFDNPGMKMDKPGYGLKDAVLAWHLNANGTLVIGGW